MPADMEIPLTTSQRWEKELEENPNGKTFFPYPIESKLWYSKEEDEKIRKDFWSAPFDPRFPQQRKQRQCFTYFVDYHRCKELKGEDYNPCNFFKNVYMDICPRYWVEKWHDQVAEGRFPAAFDR